MDERLPGAGLLAQGARAGQAGVIGGGSSLALNRQKKTGSNSSLFIWQPVHKHHMYTIGLGSPAPRIQVPSFQILNNE